MNRRLAHLLSYLFHPAIYPILGTFILLRVQPMQFPSRMIILAVLLVFCGTYLVPVLASVLLYRLGLMESLQMNKARDRRLPYIFSAVSFYFTALLLQQVDLLHQAYLFLLGSTLVIILHLLLLSRTKPSAHLAGIGGFLGLLLALSFQVGVNLIPYILATLLTSGLVASARLRLEAHTTGELWTGFLTGLFIVGGLLFL
jgi:hypothetical protein